MISVGQSIGRWTVIRISREEVHPSSVTKTLKWWKVRCQCGEESVHAEAKLTEMVTWRPGKGGCTKKACQNRKVPI